MIKRILAFCTVFSFLMSMSVSAKNTVSIEPQGDFSVYGTHTEQVAEILGMETQELQGYCSENSIVYLAVNRDNSKQIRISESTTDFSNSVVNITGLSDDKIKTLMPDILNIDNVKGEIINLSGQKIIKTQLRSTDSGGEYILTEFYTVADRKNYVLSFYTNAKADTEYIEKTLETYKCSAFLTDSNEEDSEIGFIVPVATFIFAAASVLIIISIIHDVRGGKEENE